MEDPVQHLRTVLFPNGVPFWDKSTGDLRYHFIERLNIMGLDIEVSGAPGRPDFYVYLPTQPNGLFEMEENGNDLFPVPADESGNFTAIRFLEVKRHWPWILCQTDRFCGICGQQVWVHALHVCHCQV